MGNAKTQNYQNVSTNPVSNQTLQNLTQNQGVQVINPNNWQTVQNLNQNSSNLIDIPDQQQQNQNNQGFKISPVERIGGSQQSINLDNLNKILLTPMQQNQNNSSQSYSQARLPYRANQNIRQGK